MPAKTKSTGNAEIQKLQQELAINRAMADNSPINILLADLDLRITYANAASVQTLKTLEKFLPCKAEDVVGQSIDIFHRDPMQQRRILANERNLPTRAIIQIGDQKADLLVTPVFDQAGKYIGPMVTWEVVTDKLALESKNLDYARQIAAISESQAVIEFTMDGKIVTANANFLKTMDYTLDEIQGQHHSIFADPTFARTPEYKAFWTKLNRGESDEGQYLRIGKGGKEVWIQARYNVLVDNQGKPYKVVKYATDITERRKLEERAADYVRQIEAISQSQAVIEFTLDGAIVDANSNFLGALGYRIEEIRGQHHSMFVPAAVAGSPQYKNFWAKLNRGESEEGRYLRVGKGGKEVWIQARYNALINAQGKPYKVVKYASDITEQVHLELEQQAHAERERLAQEELKWKVEELLVVVDAAASGDLTQNNSFNGDDAMGKLADGFRKMLKDLRLIIGQVVEGAAQFAEGAQVIAESSQRLASGAQTQSASVEEMSASIEELTRSIEAVKDNASEANKLAIQTNRMAEEGGQAVQKSVEAMDLIKNSSEQISEIIQVISEIASQTNLLALNAAIEAARAGEHGLGFAVVADEVRKLAERSSEAAKEISKLIKESTQRVHDGSKLSEETGKALEKIIQGVEATTSKISEIATATVEQAQNANEVANAIQQVSAVTEQSAAASEEMASSSEELGAQAGTLRDLVKRFKVE